MASAAARLHKLRLPGGQACEQAARVLIGALADRRNGGELVVFLGVGLKQDHGRARFAQRALDAGIGFLGERRIERRQRGRLARPEHRLRGFEPLARIGRHQGQSAKRGLDRAAQAIVEPHRFQIGRRACGRLAGRRVENRAGLVLDENLVAAKREAAIVQRLDHVERKRAATCRDRADRAVGVVETILGETGERRLIGLRILALRACRKRPGEKQAERDYDRDDAFVRRHPEIPRPRT